MELGDILLGRDVLRRYGEVQTFVSRAIWASLRNLEVRTVYRVVTSRLFFASNSFKRLLLKTRWVLILICSSILSVSSVERADVMLFAGNSHSDSEFLLLSLYHDEQQQSFHDKFI